MKRRLNYDKILPEGMIHVNALDKYCSTSGLERSLLELVKIRASQLNGCAYCLDMHSKDARSNGETEQRIYGLSAWDEAPYYTDRERAALGLTEAVTLISENRVEDELYDEAREVFSDEELVKLMLAIGMINVWNRLAITFQDPVGTYQPAHSAAQKPPTP